MSPIMLYADALRISIIFILIVIVLSGLTLSFLLSFFPPPSSHVLCDPGDVPSELEFLSVAYKYVLFMTTIATRNCRFQPRNVYRRL